jgi:hypothetical protein
LALAVLDVQGQPLPGSSHKILVVRPDPPRRDLPKQVLLVAFDCLKDAHAFKDKKEAEGAWKQVCTALQYILDMPEDTLWYAQENKTGRWISVKREAQRMFASMPSAGKTVYEASVGDKAESALADARNRMSLSRLADVAYRYAHAPAGREAQLWLSGLALAGHTPAVPSTTLRGTIVAIVDKADSWPTPEPGLAYVKIRVEGQLWLKADEDEKKVRARLPLKKGFVIDCLVRPAHFDRPALQADADAVIIVRTP